MTSVTEIERGIARFPRWHYEIELPGATTPIFDANHRNRHQQRRAYFMKALLDLYGGSLKGQRILDLGCNAGYWSLLCAQAGADRVVGIDGRQTHVDQANFVFESMGIDSSRYMFKAGNVFEVDSLGEEFDIVLNLGLMYHVAKTMQLVEFIAAQGADTVVTDTEIDPSRGSLMRVRPQGDSTDEPRDAVDYPLVMVPSRQAVIDLYSVFGYKTVALKPRFTSWVGSMDFEAGLRRRSSAVRVAASLASTPRATRWRLRPHGWSSDSRPRFGGGSEAERFFQRITSVSDVQKHVSARVLGVVPNFVVIGAGKAGTATRTPISS